MLTASQLRTKAIDSLKLAENGTDAQADQARVHLHAAEQYAQLARDVEQAPPEPAAIPTTVITIDGSNQFPQAIVDRLIREIKAAAP